MSKELKKRVVTSILLLMIAILCIVISKIIFTFAIFIIFAINIGKGAVSGEESSGTLEMVLSNPVSRVRFLIQKIYSLLFPPLLW